MRELSLFTGAGGGIYGTKLLGWETLGYVEYDDYCQRVIAQRIRDGIFDAAPIFGNIQTFIAEGYADAYTGMVDVVSAGFPCQPFSVAGKRAGADDSRNMWPATIEVIRRVRPRYAFLENVPGLLSANKTAGIGGYFGVVLRDLAEAGYDAEWCVLGADDVGAPHRRKRLWILAYTTGPERRPDIAERHQPDRSSAGRIKENRRLESCCQKLANTDQGREPQPQGSEQEQRQRPIDGSENLANTTRHEPGRQEPRTERERIGERGESAAIPDADSPRPFPAAQSGIHSSQESAGLRHAESERRNCSWWSVDPADLSDTDRQRWLTGSGEPGAGGWSELDDESSGQPKPELGRVAHGVADRSNRLKAIGNGQVPAVVRLAWQILNNETLAAPASAKG